MMSNLSQSSTVSENDALKGLLTAANIDADLRQRITEHGVELVERIRKESHPGIMELFLGEYGLSTQEGVALMCLAEALLRVPDGETMDALIEDKIAPSEWGKHLGKSHSSLVNASSWALYLTGKVLDENDDSSIVGILHGAIRRLGEPVIRQAVKGAMREMGRQFVLGQTIEEAIERAKSEEAKGFTYSYDMLGEAAKTERDAKHYHLAYSEAISELAHHADSPDIRQNPGISIKLSALHPRYETLKRQRVMDELVPRARALAVLAKSAGIGLNIDAEEAGRLELSLDVIEAILSDPGFAGWDGFGVVVQAYNRRAPAVLDWMYDLACRLNRRIMVRLVKGAYWDTEIKLAQVEGHAEYPVFTRKASTDVSYICCAQKLLGMTDRIYPQFATHNAHTVAAVLEMAKNHDAFEFQRLHGMGEALHGTVSRRQKPRCRIYAPVGAHKDLLAYLVRRLLENGANSSFVNQIVDENVSPKDVASDPFEKVESWLNDAANPAIRQPARLFDSRENSRGWDLSDPTTLDDLQHGISVFSKKTYAFSCGNGDDQKVFSPATGEFIGTVSYCTPVDAKEAISKVRAWSDTDASERAGILRKIADVYEENAHEIFSLLQREAGKTILDCVGELREAVDFLRYYASEAQRQPLEPAGIFACISPWNFPLAIFTGQISAALAVGNGVVAKPAESTSLIASFAASLFYQAGVPRDIFELLPGTGSIVGAALCANPKIDGVCFTGSTQTAQLINRSMAEHLAPHAPLIAETGGLNAMIVDSTALPEQAVTDILASAFQSAGQRCSALRVLYLQEDIAEPFLNMLYGAMGELEVGNPADFSTDIGPIIDENARAKICAYIETAKREGRLLKRLDAPKEGTFIGPTVVKVRGIGDLAEEIFGPVLHVATFQAADLDAVIDDINATGYGLTFGLHTRIDDRVQHVIDRVDAGNIYVNRNQIGAVVGSQPFGGDGMSGTGPKAGGPRYLRRFAKSESFSKSSSGGAEVPAKAMTEAFANLSEVRHVSSGVVMPGPTGEENTYTTLPRRRVLCLGPGLEDVQEQVKLATEAGCTSLAVAPGVANGLDGVVSDTALTELEDVDVVMDWSDNVRATRKALAARVGAIVTLITSRDELMLYRERHVCVDTTASGGNAELLGDQLY